MTGCQTFGLIQFSRANRGARGKLGRGAKCCAGGSGQPRLCPQPTSTGLGDQPSSSQPAESKGTPPKPLGEQILREQGMTSSTAEQPSHSDCKSTTEWEGGFLPAATGVVAGAHFQL